MKYSKSELKKMKRDEISDICKELNLKNLSGKTKDEMIDMILEYYDSKKRKNSKKTISIHSEKPLLKSSKKTHSGERHTISIPTSSRKNTVKKDEEEVEQNFDSMKIPEIKEYMERKGIPVPLSGNGKDGLPLKSDLLAAIISNKSRKISLKNIKIRTKTEYVCGEEKNKCGKKEICSTETGECLPQENADEYKYLEDKEGVLFGEELYYDKDNKLIGKREEVMKHVNFWNKTNSDETKRCDDIINPVKCDQAQLCNAKSGECVDDTENIRKGKYILETEGRLIVGSKEVIEGLNEMIKGVVYPADYVSKTKKKTKAEEQHELQEKLKELMLSGSDDEIEDIKEKLSELKEENKNIQASTSTRAVSSPKLREAQQDIYETFSTCLAQL